MIDFKWEERKVIVDEEGPDALVSFTKWLIDRKVPAETLRLIGAASTLAAAYGTISEKAEALFGVGLVALACLMGFELGTLKHVTLEPVELGLSVQEPAIESN